MRITLTLDKLRLGNNTGGITVNVGDRGTTTTITLPPPQKSAPQGSEQVGADDLLNLYEVLNNYIQSLQGEELLKFWNWFNRGGSEPEVFYGTWRAIIQGFSFLTQGQKDALIQELLNTDINTIQQNLIQYVETRKEDVDNYFSQTRSTGQFDTDLELESRTVDYFTITDDLIREKVKPNFIDILNKMSDIFYVDESERKVDQFKKFIIKNLKLYDVHAPDERPIFNKITIKQENTIDNPTNTLGEAIRTFADPTKSAELKRTELQSLRSSLNTEVFEVFSDGLSLSSENRGTQLSPATREDIFNAGNASSTSTSTKNVQIDETMKEDEFALQRYAKFGQLNAKFKRDPTLVQLEGKVVNLEFARSLLKDYGDTNNLLYDCDKSDENSFFTQPIELGLRLIVVYKSKKGNIPKAFYVGEKSFNIKDNSENYLFVTEIASPNAAEITDPLVGKTIERYNYNLLVLGTSEIKIDTNLKVSQAYEILSPSEYDKLFFPVLRERLLKESDLELILNYCFPVKEIAMTAAMHTYLINSNENASRLFEEVKNAIKSNIEILDNFGVKTNTTQKIKKIKEKQKQEINNEGNPAGPLNFDLLKIYLRTPIHILRGLATIVDPNIFFADKIVAGASIAGSLLGKKIYIPYSLASLSLLPFPVFSPPYAPSLTSYNIALPLGPAFLVLEPLLWDLPWFKNVNSDPTNPDRIKNLSDYGIDTTNRTSSDAEQTNLLSGTDAASESPSTNGYLLSHLDNSSDNFVDKVIEELIKRCQ